MAESTEVHLEMKAGRWRRRTMTVVAAVAVAIAVFYLETTLLGLDLASPAMSNRDSMMVTVNSVIGAAAAAGVVGWVLMAILERITTRARGIWTGIAVTVLLLSLVAPFTGTGVELKVRLGLAALHLVVGLILIPLIPDWPPKRARMAASA